MDALEQTAQAELVRLRDAITWALLDLDALMEDPDGIDPWALQHITDARDVLRGTLR